MQIDSIYKMVLQSWLNDLRSGKHRLIKCLHTEYRNEDVQFTISDFVLNTTVKQKELGLTISSKKE